MRMSQFFTKSPCVVGHAIDNLNKFSVGADGRNRIRKDQTGKYPWRESGVRQKSLAQTTLRAGGRGISCNSDASKLECCTLILQYRCSFSVEEEE